MKTKKPRGRETFSLDGMGKLIISYSVETFVIALQIGLPVNVVGTRRISLVGIRAGVTIYIRAIVLSLSPVELPRHETLLIPSGVISV